MSPEQEKESWVKEFYENFTVWNKASSSNRWWRVSEPEATPELLIAFISRLLHEERERIREGVEKLEGLGERGIDGKPIEWNVGYNQGLKDIKSLLTTKPQ